MNSMKDRLRQVLEDRQMKPTDLVKSGTLSRSAVYFLLDGTTKPDKVRSKTVDWLTKALVVNREWLLTGRGQRDAGAESERGQHSSTEGEVLQEDEAEMLELFRLASSEMKSALLASARASLLRASGEPDPALLRRVNPKHRERLRELGLLPDGKDHTRK